MKEKQSNGTAFKVVVIIGLCLTILIGLINSIAIFGMSYQVNENLKAVSDAYEKNLVVYNKNVDLSNQMKDKINEMINLLNGGITIKR